LNRPLKRRKLAILALVTLSPLFISGCWSKVEVNDRTFVTGVFVDLAENNQLRLGLGFPLPNRLEATQKGGGGRNPYAMVEKTGVDMPSAIHKIQTDLTRRITWGHVQIIVVGEEMARSGIGRIMEHAIRLPSFDMKTYFFIAPKALPTAYLTTVFERFPSEVIRKFMSQGSTLKCRVKDLLVFMSSDGDSLVPMLTIGKAKLVSEEGKLSEWVGVSGAALFRNDQMVGKLNQEEMQAAMWVKGELKKAYITFLSPDDDKPITVLVVRSDAKATPKIGRKHPAIEIAVKADVELRASESSMDLSDPGNVRRLEQAFEHQLVRQIEKMLDKTQSYGVDPFQFGQLIRWRHPDEWNKLKQRWRQYYQDELTFDVKASMTIKSNGKEKDSFSQTERYRTER